MGSPPRARGDREKLPALRFAIRTATMRRSSSVMWWRGLGRRTANSRLLQFALFGDTAVRLKSTLDEVLLFAALVRKLLYDLVLTGDHRLAHESGGKAHGLSRAESWVHVQPSECPNRASMAQVAPQSGASGRRVTIF